MKGTVHARNRSRNIATRRVSTKNGWHLDTAVAFKVLSKHLNSTPQKWQPTPFYNVCLEQGDRRERNSGRRRRKRNTLTYQGEWRRVTRVIGH